MNNIIELIKQSRPFNDEEADAIISAVEAKRGVPILLELTREEAEMLHRVCRSVGGPPDAGHPRAAIDSVQKKLQLLDIRVRKDVVRSGNVYLYKNREVYEAEKQYGIGNDNDM